VLPALDFPSAEEAVKGLAADCASLLAAGVGCVVLTLGALGVVLARHGEEGEATFTHLSAPPATVVRDGWLECPAR
jgi:sugar/nucleoside kinase (ribokinase family)